MADENEEIEGGEAEEGEGKAKKKLSGKTLIMFIALPALLLLLGGGGAAWFFLFKGDPEADMHAEAGMEGEHGGSNMFDPSHLIFFPMPEILVNLNTSDGRNMYLKLNVELELREGADLEALEAVMPRVIDKFQVYLRELRIEDLKGSTGMFRIKEELLRRVNIAVRPLVVQDVLFKELIIQ